MGIIMVLSMSILKPYALCGEGVYLMKLSVIYDSRSGNTKQAAEWIVKGMNDVIKVDARAFPISSVDEDFVNQSKGIVIGSPSYCMLMTPDMHKWLLESAMHLELAGKLGGAFSTVQYTHGGGECVIQSIMLHEMDYGMLCYSGGSSWGTPYIHIGPVGVNNNVESHNTLEYYRDNFEIYGNRFARKAAELFAGQVGQ
jgi:NAD(P)H dehydrogenase (quinone)